MDIKMRDGDITLDNGELEFVRGRDAIAQDLQMAWMTWLGETPYDTTVGVPYLQVFFRARNPNLDAIRFIMKQIGERRVGVISIALSVSLDALRSLTATGTAQTEEGEFDFTRIINTESLTNGV